MSEVKQIEAGTKLEIGGIHYEFREGSWWVEWGEHCQKINMHSFSAALNHIVNMQATVQPLVDALEGLLPLFDFLHIEMHGTRDPAQEWDEYEQARFDAQSALAAYRKAMGGKA